VTSLRSWAINSYAYSSQMIDMSNAWASI